MANRKYHSSQLVRLAPNALNRCVEPKVRNGVTEIHSIAGYQPISIGKLCGLLHIKTNNSNFKNKTQDQINYAFVASYLLDQLGLMIAV